ncbi:MAG: phosphate/phosphite/phosphonate ABC transporter substrate-binding protein [Thiohalomonadaceae bacterium]
MAIRTLLSLLLLLASQSISAEWILSAPPREDAAEAKRLYRPLADKLSQITRERVVFEAPASWATYSRDMQQGKYDFVLDGPHFVAWRIKNSDHTPLVRFDGNLGYTVFTTPDGPANLDELRFAKVCSMASPNLAAVVLLAQYTPYSAPAIVAPRGGVKGAFEAFLKGRCRAVILPSYFLARLPPEQTAGLRPLYSSGDMPNLTLSAGPRVPAATRTEIAELLVQPGAWTGLEDLLARLAGNGTGKLIPARAEEYAGQEKLLEGLVWGW